MRSSRSTGPGPGQIAGQTPFSSPGAGIKREHQREHAETKVHKHGEWNVAAR